MQFVPSRPFFRALRSAYASKSEGYFWDALGALQEFVIGARVSRKRVEAAARTFVATTRSKPPYFIFTDRLAGWADVPERWRKSPAAFQSLDDVVNAIRRHSHFRGGTAYADNYYLTDSAFTWFFVFCHHDDVHVILPPPRARVKAVRAWLAATGATAAT